ncbi:dihydrolipoyl dehydrogenase family protein [Blattabacterium cuenoti]|uniref:dihydrolipoyl dehydrogenase family protein n=1 Tax=Blattabacterium cuenoti TaxID=1653831 RepID=UPI00163B8C98|nr:FAD-dependent oxidoreductase [Blattabacterium cuenoti]
MNFDVIILGGGQAGYVSAIRSSQLGMKTAIIEKNSIGNNYLYFGCVPIKFILNKIKILQSLKENQNLFGVNYNNINPNFSNIISECDNIVNKIKNNILFLIKKNKIHIIYGNAILKKHNKVEVIKNNNIEEHYASHIIIATGSTNKIWKKNIYDKKKIITYKEAILLSENIKDITIVGSGYISLEFVYLYYFLGAKIRIVEFNNTIFPNGDYDISKYLEIYYKNIGIEVYTNSIIDNIKKKNDKVFFDLLKNNNSIKNIKSDAILFTKDEDTIPNIKSIGLENIGIQVDNNFIIVDENYKTNIPGYYAIGDVIRPYSTINIASKEAINCIENIKGLNYKKIDYNNIPRHIISNLEIATIGYTEKEAIKNGYQLLISKFPFNSLNSAIIYGNTDGFIKVIFDKEYDEWLGCHIIGKNIGNIISEVMISRNLETTAHEMLNGIYSHPSLNESIYESIISAYK